MRNELIKLIPEFDLIEDDELREKCLQTWESALEQGGWQVADLLELPFTLLIDPCPVNYVEHVRAVTLTSIGAAKAMQQVYGDLLPINMDYLVAGGLLHDIGKLVEYEQGAEGLTVQTAYGKLIRHPFSGMALAARFDLPPAVQHMIAAHAGEGDKVQRSTEATIINHADFINFESLKRAQTSKELAARMSR
jgi:putative nucleotidyltransferase with HDIG domain